VEPVSTNLAVMDWGIGGLGFYKALTARKPDAKVVYVSDAGFKAYGKVPRAELAARLTDVLAKLAKERAVDRVVMACNAASTVLGDVSVDGVAVTGVIEPALEALKALAPQKIGVIGGGLTIESGLFREALRAAGHEVKEQVAQPLSAHVEAGRLDGADVRKDVEAAVAGMKDVQTLVLACTHYGALLPHLQRALPGVEMFDPAEATAAWVEQRWSLESAMPRSRFFTSGDYDGMRRAGKAAFGVVMQAVEKL
jgi:glutamate racemase